MTFECSRKKQVLVLQPRGKALYEDDSSFGSKMLAKMGWTKGSGLGKEQHGSLDFIQIRYKNNANGLGFDGLKDNQWTENESQFDSLLKTLNENSRSNSCSGDEKPQKTEKKSLEEKSKHSRARVHYKKFTRGKDVHKYSEKELANILGKKTLDVEEKTEIQEEAEIVEERPNKHDGNLIVNTVTVKDYFKQKMEEKAQNRKEPTIICWKRESKRSLNSGDGEDFNVELPNVIEKVKKKKKKLMSNESHEPSENPPKKKKTYEDEVLFEVADEDVAIETSKSFKKKKLKKQSKIELTQSKPEIELVEKRSKPHNEESIIDVADKPAKLPNKSLRNAGESNKLSGANAVYSSNVIQIPSHVAQKISCMAIDNFTNANVANIVGYGLSDDIEIKTVHTKVGENINNTDKYSLYNMDRLTTRQRFNPRKIMSKIKRTKKSIQVL